MKLVNCGCGNKYIDSKEWINLDFCEKEGVTKCNILRGLPLADESVDVVYSSCMLEHFTPKEAEDFLKECFRVLKSEGIVRIVVPDLENVCREYLKILDDVRKDVSYANKYRYIIIELLDQMTRNYSGGEMQKYWESEECDKEYVSYRTGYPAGWGEEKIGLIDKVKAYFSYRMYKFFNKFKIYREIQLGKFMLSGEVHKWMYDSYSLSELLERNGYTDVKIFTYNESSIDNWDQYMLEVDKQGKEYKPHSIYIEGKKK